jgi:hypothetical protein
MKPPLEQPYRIHYEFKFANNEIKIFRIKLHPKTICVILDRPVKKEDWMRLDNNQCACCPLSPETREYCPVAINIGELTEVFGDMVSYDRCLVRCVTLERIYIKKTTLMEGLASVFGVIIATSDCPIMSFLKPMARFHLPFSTPKETIFRVASVYMLRQYFNRKKNRAQDMDLELLDMHYKNVSLVNRGLIARLNTVVVNDADKNAINILFSLSQILSREINYSLNSLEFLFNE